MREMLAEHRSLLAGQRALVGRVERFSGRPAVLSVWRVEIHGASGYYRQAIIPMAIDANGHRLPTADAMLAQLRDAQPTVEGVLTGSQAREMAISTVPEMLRREVEHRGLLQEGTSLATHLMAWIEMA